MLALNTIHKQDCIEAMQQLDPGSVDLVFADPPFNIGYAYDVYKDRKAPPEYLNWSRQWIEGVHRVLKPTGTFWLAIGDDYAAELKILSQEIGFHCRSWVLWYYTFGVNCKYKFSRSHTHLFHFVKDAKTFTFNGAAISVPSARQTVYADARAAKEGRLPDDTWILRPQDLTEGLNPDEDTWYFPRVAGTFKEREGFHGCQMPEQLLGRIIKVSSSPGELVLDPFSGSATTVAAAKKLGRNFLAFDISDEYITRGLGRLQCIVPGETLDGSAEPKVSAPATPQKGVKKGSLKSKAETNDGNPPNYDSQIIEAFRKTSQGFSPDRLIVDPNLNKAFLDACQQLGANTTPFLLNRRLLYLRKSAKMKGIKSQNSTHFTREHSDPYLFASEIAWAEVFEQTKASLDDIFCNPSFSELFDDICRTYAPGYSPLEYRWGALTLRKAKKGIQKRSEGLTLPKDRLKPYEPQQFKELDDNAGLYVVSIVKNEALYVGESLNLGLFLNHHFSAASYETDTTGWNRHGEKLLIEAVTFKKLPGIDLQSRGPALSRQLMAYQQVLIRTKQPKLNKESYA